MLNQAKFGNSQTGKKVLYFFLCIATISCSQKNGKEIKTDWLTDGKPRITQVLENQAGEITLDNGLIRRSFVIFPNVTCYDFTNHRTGEQLIRAVQPEARLTLNGKIFSVGGLYGQKEMAYFKKEWLQDLHVGNNDFQYVDHEITEPEKHINWKSRTWADNQKSPTGKQLIFKYSHPDFMGLELKIHYEMYDHLPLIGKYLTLKNEMDSVIRIDQVVHEILAVPEEESAVVGSVDQMKKPHQFYIESNYAFNNAMKADLSDQTTHWKTDSAYTSQVNYNLETPSLLEVYPDHGIGIDLLPGEDFKSIRTYELILDGYDRQRNGLARRKMYRAIAPWTTQNPIFMHLVSTDPDQVRNAIDQCAETGYEGVILSFGSGLDMEDTTAANIQKFRELADYAHQKNILLGGYSLFSSRRISDEHDVIHPLTGKPGGAMFGNAPCMASQWGLDYLTKLKYFFEHTGFDIFENDGPYPGDLCASETHPGHRDLGDSQWVQIGLQKELYHWMNERGIYINAPDWYFLDGSHKIALGYREVNFALPREQQKILNRQNIHDGTIEKTAAMSWGFVPLTAYHGGGPEAVLEPLNEHLNDYRQLMMQYYGAGVQACYRGPRLYDTEETKAVVMEVLEWYKKYRKILNADMMHLRRADGRDWDGWMHLAHDLEQKGLAMLFNPTMEDMVRKIELPLYYTGLEDFATISIEEGNAKLYKLKRDYTIEVEVTIPANGYTWLLVN